MTISSIGYCLFFAPAVLLAGAGFERALLTPENGTLFALNFLKGVLAALLTVLAVFPLARLFLIPAGMGELAPIIAALLFTALSALLEAMIAVITRKSASEFIVPLLAVLLALFQSGDFLSALASAFFSITAWYAFVLLMYTVKKRLAFASPRRFFTEDALMLISASAVMLLLGAWGAAWMGAGGAP